MKYIRNIFSVIALLSVLAVTGCQKDDKAGDITGSWHLVSWAGDQPDVDVYLSFDQDGTFDLYQRYDSPYYDHLDGTWTLTDGVLAGVYGDGSSWGGSYTVVMNQDTGEMTLTDIADASDISVYTRASIPEDILSGDLGLKSTAPGNILIPVERRFL